MYSNKDRTNLRKYIKPLLTIARKTCMYFITYHTMIAHSDEYPYRTVILRDD